MDNRKILLFEIPPSMTQQQRQPSDEITFASSLFRREYYS